MYHEPAKIMPLDAPHTHEHTHTLQLHLISRTLQIFAFIGICESFSYEKCFYGQPGDGNLGFDPLGMGKNPATLTYYKVCTK
jgi:hypothetical protein